MNQTEHCRISRLTKLFLRIALPLLVLSSLTLLLFCQQECRLDPVYAKHFYRPLLEYPIAGLTITAAGALLIDYIQRNH